MCVRAHVYSCVFVCVLCGQRVGRVRVGMCSGACDGTCTPRLQHTRTYAHTHTLLAHQCPISSLNDALFSKSWDMSVTLPVSQNLMWPYVAVAAVALATHASTAVCAFALVIGVNPGRRW